MEINLNDDSFNASEGVAIFNGGKAGVAENITVTLSKKTAEDKEFAPDYKIIFTDENGGTCNTPLWYVTKETQWNSVEELIKKQGKVLKHLLHCALGPNAQLPVVNSAQAMLDEAMKMLKGALPKLGQVRILANYGTEEHRKKFIQPRSWVPFIEAMNVPIAESVLKVSDIDGMTRLQEDEDMPSEPGAGAKSDNDEEDW